MNRSELIQPHHLSRQALIYVRQSSPGQVVNHKEGLELQYALQERPRPRLTSEDVRRAITGLSPSWENFYHLVADTLNRVLDEKEKAQ